MTSLAQTKDGQGNCTQMGNFPVGVMAVLNRTLDCDPGWSAGSWPNGDVRCYRCPENSTWSGSDCVCGPGYYKDPRTKLCLPGCTSDAECSTGDFCRTGLCNLLQHRCQTTATYCDDDKKCTVDSCEFGQCANTFDKSSCTCTLAASIPVRKIQVKIPAVDLSVGLPGMPGSLGVKADITGKLTLKRPSCVNDCKGEASGSGEMALAVTVGLQTDSISGEASYSQTEDHEIDCDQASCLQTCKADSCDKTTAKGALTVAREGTLKPLGWFKPEVNAKTPWGLQWTISVKGKGSITDELEYESTTRVGVLTTPCVNCTRLSSKITGSLGGKGSAEISLPPSGSAKVGASGSADITVTVSGGSQGSAGECYMGDGACGFIRADARGTVIGSFSAQMGWWKVGVTCSGVYSACSERNQCATCTCPNCASNDGTWSCNVDQNIGPPPPPKGKP